MAKKKEELFGMSKKEQVLVSSIGGALLVAIVTMLYVPADMFGLFIGIALAVGFVPYSIYNYTEKKKIKKMEEILPNFLKDLAEGRKTGMTLPQALYRSSKIDYEELTPEVKKMANQVSWGIPFSEVLKKFSDRCKSRFIQRSMAIVIEAQVSGGALTDTLDSVARDARLIKETEAERRAKLNHQAMMMYAIFFLFVAIVVSLQKLMLPMVTSNSFSVSVESPAEIMGFYKNLFFSMIMIQAVFNGMIAGQISEGSPILGLKHSALFVIVGVIAAWLFIF